MNKTEKFIYVLLALIAVFLLVDRFMIPCVAVIGVLFFLLVSKNFKLRTSKMFTSLLITACVATITLGLSVIPQFSKLIDLSVVIKELLRVIIYGMILQMMAILKVDQKYHAMVWKWITIFVVGVAFLQYIKIFDINLLLQRIYGASKQFIYAEATDLSRFRGGSVFVNPNVFACFLAAMLGNYLVTLDITKESLLSKLIMFALIMTGFVLSGSRTGMILSVLLVVYHIYSTSHMGLATFLKKFLLIAMGLAVGLFLLKMVFSIDLLENTDLRMFRVEDGVEESFTIKVDIFGNLISNMNLVNLLIGYGPYDYGANVDLMVDFDLGYFVVFFGVVGLVVYCFLLRGIFQWGDRTLESRRKLNMAFLLITVIFGLTAGVYFNLRIFCVYLLVFLPARIDRKTNQQLA